MTPDEAYEQFDDLLEIRNTLREIFEEHLPSTNNCPYVKAEVFKDLEDDRPSPLKHTVYQFEVIMNTLLGSFGSYRSPVAISLLSHITTTLDQISVLVSEQLGYEADSKIKSGEIPDEMLHPDSFNPANDTRLHEYYANRIKKSFDPNYLSREEVLEARRLQARVNNDKA